MHLGVPANTLKTHLRRALLGSARSRKIAVYRDERGDIHRLSAVCTHLYCIVRWNDTEKTWDCPCHGSRFATDGTVIQGPASTSLASRDSPS